VPPLFSFIFLPPFSNRSCSGKGAPANPFSCACRNEPAGSRVGSLSFFFLYTLFLFAPQDRLAGISASIAVKDRASAPLLFDRTCGFGRSGREEFHFFFLSPFQNSVRFFFNYGPGAAVDWYHCWTVPFPPPPLSCQPMGWWS